MLDAFWRALAYCLHPRVIGLSLVPLVLMTVLSLGLGYFFWQPAVDGVSQWLSTLGLYQSAGEWLSGWGLSGLVAMVPAALVLMLATPAVLVLSLLIVAAFMTSAMADLVGQRRFPTMERKRGASVLSALWWSLLSTLVALAVLVLSMPLWLIPPLVLILPPVIWGWLTYRVFAFDSLAQHASREERQTVLREHRGSLLFMGILTGFLGAAPSLLWASAALFLALAPLLVPLAVWIYTLVFALASLWFSHYTLAALEALRARAATSGAGSQVLEIVPSSSPSEPQAPGQTPLLPGQ